MSNRFSLILPSNSAVNVPLVARFGRLLEHLGTADYIHPPPSSAQINGNWTSVEVQTPCCADCLTAKLKEAGFEVTVGFTNASEKEHETCCC